ncbi:MAG TPA: DNA-binding protein WhiA [Candidatus Merdisoma faecalis]|uniref:DNA-binding protein WhiA n=1 Tax=Lachnoclostridium sp. An138 TaxID=1965560 RepID=UPI000B38831B|nr:DNA-binding protein WhiA [Lachnoclostridium sp. An138]OUQ18211.1 DNA-binding protein WhiA [Lachnoclostridium sp. An138]HIR96581.1 DNA-binding protein WhiA [Candidatus Merdisoma faecalis]
MSFSSEIKQELSWQLPSARHCRLAEISAILSFCSHVEAGTEGTGNVRMHTENLAVARKYFTLLKKTFNINMNVSVRQNRKPHGNRSFEITALTDMTAVRHVLIQNPCCRRAYIRGAFLASGSVSDPEKGYHFEIVCADSARAEQLSAMLESFGIEAKITLRKHSYILYVKEGSQIADILNVMEAHVGLMKFENIRILKEMRNSVNRQVNCETANLNKTVSAAVKQIEDIQYIQSTIGFEKLPENLAEIARLRLEQPGMSLKELGQMLTPPVGKSGVNHRLRKLSFIAEELREHKEERIL